MLRFIVDTVIYDAAYIASQLARHLHDPCARHMAALPRAARYLAGKRDANLFYRVDADTELRAYSDFDYARARVPADPALELTNYLHRDLFLWKSVLQKAVTLSTGEAEYMAASETTRIVAWPHLLAKELRIPIPTPTKPFIDNAAELSMAAANGPTTRSKHIDTRARFIHEQVKRNRIRPLHTPGANQLADMFTKHLALSKL